MLHEDTQKGTVIHMASVCTIRNVRRRCSTPDALLKAPSRWQAKRWTSCFSCLMCFPDQFIQKIIESGLHPSPFPSPFWGARTSSCQPTRLQSLSGGWSQALLFRHCGGTKPLCCFLSCRQPLSLMQAQSGPTTRATP